MKSPNIVIDYVVSSIGRIGMDGLSVNKGCGAGPCYLLHINIFIYRPTQPAHHELFSWNKGSGGQCSWTLTTGTNQSSWEEKIPEAAKQRFWWCSLPLTISCNQQPKSSQVTDVWKETFQQSFQCTAVRHWLLARSAKAQCTIHNAQCSMHKVQCAIVQCWCIDNISSQRRQREHITSNYSAMASTDLLWQKRMYSSDYYLEIKF